MHSHRANFLIVSAQERLFVVVRIVQCFVRIVQDALYSTAHFRARTFEGIARQPNHTLGDLAARTSRCVTIPVHFSLCVRRPSRTDSREAAVRRCIACLWRRRRVALRHCHVVPYQRKSPCQHAVREPCAPCKAQSLSILYATRPYVFGCHRRRRAAISARAASTHLTRRRSRRGNPFDAGGVARGACWRS